MLVISPTQGYIVPTRGDFRRDVAAIRNDFVFTQQLVGKICEVSHDRE